MKLKKLLSVILSLAMVFGTLSACVPPSPSELAISFIGETEGKIIYTYSGNEKTIAVDTLGLTVNYEITYFNADKSAQLEGQPLDAGSYIIKAEIKQDGYIGSHEAQLIIEKMTLNMSAEDISVFAGQDFNPEFIIENKPSSITNQMITITYSQNETNLGEQKPQNPGIYTINYVLQANNYQAQTTSTLTIAANLDEITIQGLNVTYDGTPKAVTLLGADKPYYYNHKVLYNDSLTPPTNAGTYTIKASLEVNGVEQFLPEATLIIAKKTVQIIAQDQEFEVEDEITHDFRFSGSQPYPSNSDVTITYTGIIDTNYPESQTAPVEVGTYRVVFNVNTTNFLGSTYCTYKILPRTGGLITWQNLKQVYGDNLDVIANLQEFQTFQSLSFAGKNDTIYDISEVQPTNAGTYEVTLTYLSDGVLQEPKIVELIISPKEIEFSANDASFVCVDDQITHDIEIITDGILPLDSDFSAVYYKIVDEIPSESPATLPLEAGTYKAQISILNPNFSGTASATYLILPRTGRLALEQVIFINTDEFDLSIEGLDDYHIERTITYVGLDLEYDDTIAPTQSGKYQVTFSCLTDGTLEILEATLYFKYVFNTDLDSIAYNSAYQKEFSELPSNEWISFKFIDFEGNYGQTATVVGVSSYIVEKSSDLFNISTQSGTVNVYLENTLDALNYAKHYYEQIATDVASVYYGIADTTVKTYVSTLRYKTSNPESNISAYYRTLSNAENVIDVRFSLDTAIVGDTAFSRTNKSFTKSSAANVVHSVNYGDASYTERTKEQYQSQYGGWISDFSVYDLSEANINLTSSTFTKNPDGTYELKVVLKDCGQASKTQVKAYSGQSYGSWVRTNLTITLDEFGRATKIVTDDEYKVRVIILVTVKLSGTETFYYGTQDNILTLNNEDGNRNVTLSGTLAHTQEIVSEYNLSNC